MNQLKTLTLIFCLSLIYSCEDRVTSLKSSGQTEGGVFEQKPIDDSAPPTNQPSPENPGEPPKVVKVYAQTEDGSYNGGKVIYINLIFSESITVLGSPKLSLDLINRTALANFESVSKDSKELVFSYEVSPGDKTRDLSYTNEIALSAEEDSIIGLDGIVANTVLPKVGSENSLSGNANISVGFSDNFDGNSISSQWSLVDRDGWDADQNGASNDDEKLSVLQANSGLVLLGRGKNLYRNKKEYVAAYLDKLNGDYEFSVKVSSISKTHRWSKTGFIVANNVNDLDHGGVYTCAVTQKRGVIVQYSSRGDGLVNKLYKEANSSFPVWLRIQKVGNDLYCYYRFSETAPWSGHRTNPINIGSLGANFNLGLFSTSHSKYKTIHSVFQDFQDLSY